MVYSKKDVKRLAEISRLKSILFRKALKRMNKQNWSNKITKDDLKFLRLEKEERKIEYFSIFTPKIKKTKGRKK